MDAALFRVAKTQLQYRSTRLNRSGKIPSEKQVAGKPQDEERLVAAAIEMSEAEDLTLASRAWARELQTALLEMPLDVRLRGLAQTPAGYARICLAVLHLEFAKMFRQSLGELFALFVLRYLQGDGPRGVEEFRTFANEHYVYSESLEARLEQKGWSSDPQIAELLARHRTEYLLLAHDQLTDYLEIVRGTARGMASLFQPLAQALQDNDREHADSKCEVAHRNAALVADVDDASASLSAIAGGAVRRSETLRRYLLHQAMTEAEALGVTVEEDAELFERRFAAAVRKSSFDAWDMLQRFRSMVLLDQLAAQPGDCTAKDVLHAVRASGPRLVEGSPEVDRLTRFKERVALDALLWCRGVDLSPKAEPAGLRDVLATLVKPASAGGSQGYGAVLIEYVVTEIETYALVSRADRVEPQAIRIPLGRSDIAREVRSLLLGRSAFRPGRFEAGWRIVGGDDVPELKVLGALVSWIPGMIDEGAHLCIVPYGITHRVPFQALPISHTAGAPPLIECYTLSYLPCASLLTFCRPHERKVTRRSGRGLLASALYEGQDCVGLADHLDALRSTLDPVTSVVLQQLGATPNAVASPVHAGHWKLVYIHGHGYFVSEDPLSSYIALSDGHTLANPNAAIGSHHRLRAEDLMTAGLKGELALIAACVSGRSEVRPGDELLGWVRALLFRRFESVVTALWSFEVESGRALVERFAQSWLHEGRTKAEALADAQRALLRGQLDERWQHPYYWGSFFLAGEWE